MAAGRPYVQKQRAFAPILAGHVFQQAKAHCKVNIFQQITADLRGILAYERKSLTLKAFLWALFGIDAWWIMILFRKRQWARRWHIPFVGRFLRGVQTALYGIELGIDIELGSGVYFVHPVGVVIGGQSRVGEGCVFMGSNTVGAARGGESPTIGANCVVGAGARILGNITVGEKCFIGANAVVTQDIEANSVAVGIPAKRIKANS